MGERRTAWLLIALLAGQLLLLASGVPGPDGEGSVLQSVGLRMVAPLARLTAATGNFFARRRQGLATRRALVAENRELKAEVERLQLEISRLHGLEAEVDRLTEAVGYTRDAPGEHRLANIVYLDHTSSLRSLIVHARGGGMEVSQPVLAAAGLVGRVIEVAGPYARVQLVTDTAAGVGAMVERTRRQGVVRGISGGRLQLDYIPLQADVVPGDRLMTAGNDGIFPLGIPIGTVTAVEPGDEFFYRILVKPAVDFRTLDHVYLTRRQKLPEQLR